jgi:aminopeptidase C
MAIVFVEKNGLLHLKKKLSKKADLTGKKFGNALVIEFLGNEKHGYKWWGLICDCGVLFAARSRELKRGHTKSCGCLQKKVAKKMVGITNYRTATLQEMNY